MEKILWAVDSLADKNQQLRAAETLKAFLKGSNASIEPVTVLSPDQLRVPAHAFDKHSEDYHLEADRILKALLSKLKLPGLKPLKILVSDKFSRRASVEKLLEYARNQNFSLIAMNTRSHKGLSRLLLGSFAETLMLHSSIPLLITNPKSIPPKKFQHLLFATDLSEASEKAFQQVLPVAKSLGVKVVLYHKLEYVIPETMVALHQTPIYDKFMEEDTESRQKQLEAWEKKANSAGIKTVVVFDKKPGFVTDAVIKLSKKFKGSLVAMASRSTPIASTFIGSITRQVIRETQSPMWVVHV